MCILVHTHYVGNNKAYSKLLGQDFLSGAAVGVSVAWVHPSISSSVFVLFRKITGVPLPCFSVRFEVFHHWLICYVTGYPALGGGTLGQMAPVVMEDPY